MKSKKVNSQNSEELVLTKQERIDEIMAHYDFLVSRCIKRYYNSTMQELWKALDKLKAKMEQELNEVDRYYMDIEDATGNAG